LGDWIDLEGGITVKAYAYPSYYAEEGGFQYTGDNTRPIVVGINSFNGKNDNSKQHVAFQFKNILVTRRMNPTDTHVDGYAESEMRKYLVPYSGSSGNFLTGLKNAWVPVGVLWGPKRSVAIKSFGTATNEISDLLWLPTEREMFGPSSYWTPNSEIAANQAWLEYYNSDTRRIKSLHWYWMSSPFGLSAYLYYLCYVSAFGSSGVTLATSFFWLGEGDCPRFLCPIGHVSFIPAPLRGGFCGFFAAGVENAKKLHFFTKICLKTLDIFFRCGILDM
jgi:hypothetical protein